MKTLFISILALLSVSLMGQSNEFGNAKIRKADKVVWFGLDFTKAYFVGREGFTNPDDITDRFFESWNALILAESDKYNISGALKKAENEYDLSVAEERNETISADDLVKDKPHEISKEDVAEIVSAYVSKEYTEGVGLLYVVENFNKLANEATVWVTFFDISTHEVIATKRFSGKPGGFGLRNFWAGAIHEIIEQMGDQYERWLKKN